MASAPTPLEFPLDEDDLFGDVDQELFDQRLSRQVDEDEDLDDPNSQRESEAGRAPAPPRDRSSAHPFNRGPERPGDGNMFATPDPNRPRVERIAGLFDLSQDSIDLVKKVCTATVGTEEFTTVMCFQAHMMERLLESKAVQKLTEAYTAPDQLKEFLRLKFSQMIVEENLESYSLIKDDQKRLIELSLERSAMVFLQKQDDEFKEKFLPSGFGTKDGSNAQAIVLSVVKDILKYARSGLRGSLLTNILPDSGKPPTKPVPTASSMVAQIIRSYLKKDTLETDEQLCRAAGMRFRLRIILLRYVTVHYFKSPMSNRRKCQWHAIDAILADLRKRAPEFQRAFAKLIIARDAAHFDGLRTYDEISESSNFPIPAEADVLAYLAPPPTTPAA